MREYQRTENPVYLLMAFIIATDAELYPPQGILRWLRDGFREWVLDVGDISLERALDLSGRGRHGKAIREWFSGLMWEDRMIEVYRLQQAFRISLQDASGIVGSKRIAGEFATMRDFAEPDADTIYDRAKRTGHKPPKSIRDRVDAMVDAMSDTDRRALLHSYPVHTWQHIPKLKKYLG